MWRNPAAIFDLFLSDGISLLPFSLSIHSSIHSSPSSWAARGTQRDFLCAERDAWKCLSLSPPLCPQKMEASVRTSGTQWCQRRDGTCKHGSTLRLFQPPGPKLSNAPVLRPIYFFTDVSRAYTADTPAFSKLLSVRIQVFNTVYTLSDFKNYWNTIILN